MSVFLDNELEEQSSVEVREHLALCEACSKVCEDLAMIIDFCQLDTEEAVIPPNPQALWCRINNIIESEVQAEIVKENKEKVEAARTETETGWLPRRWNFSFMQVASAVLGIAVRAAFPICLVKRAGRRLSSRWQHLDQPWQDRSVK